MATLSPDGKLSARISINLGGELAINQDLDSRRLSEHKKRELDDAQFHLPSHWQLATEAKSSCDRKAGRCLLDAEAYNAGYAPPAADRWIIPLDFLSLAIDQRSLADRKRDLFITDAEVADESVLIHFPAGYGIKTLPQNIDEKSDAFDVHIGYRQDDSGVTIHRTLKLKPGRYKVDTLAAAAHALTTFTSAPKEVLIFTKN